MFRALLTAVPFMLAAAAPPAPTPAPEAQAFDRFVTASAPVCQNQPSRRCVDMGFGYADVDRDGGLTLDELLTVRAHFDRWLAWRGPSLQPGERGAVLFGAQLVDAIGLPKLFASYDADGDGRVTKAELLADVRLDERPLGKVLTDENAVDRQALQRRLGALAPAVEGILRRPR